ncbi:MAG TPA: hypothetical protein VIP77_15470 [Jiangellaceae bacterium]
MTAYDQDTQDKALAEVERLRAHFDEIDQSLEKAREALQEAIVRHLRERNAPPGRIATASKYDRNHVGRLARAAGVQPLREPKPKTRRRKTPPAAE